MMYVPWSYNYSKSLSPISERLGGGRQCANLQKGNQYWVSMERAKNEPKRGKHYVFGPKDVYYFLQKEPGSAATVLPLIVQPGLVPALLNVAIK